MEWIHNEILTSLNKSRIHVSGIFRFFMQQAADHRLLTFETYNVYWVCTPNTEITNKIE